MQAGRILSGASQPVKSTGGSSVTSAAAGAAQFCEPMVKKKKRTQKFCEPGVEKVAQTLAWNQCATCEGPIEWPPSLLKLFGEDGGDMTMCNGPGCMKRLHKRCAIHRNWTADPSFSWRASKGRCNQCAELWKCDWCNQCGPNCHCPEAG